MVNRYILRTALSVCCAATLLCACNQKNEESQPKDNSQAPSAGSNNRIAYVEIDTLMNQYQFCKDYTLLMTRRSQSMQATLQSRGQALQRDAMAFQQKMQSNGYTQAQAQAVQISLQKRQQGLQALQEKLSKQFDAEQTKYNNEMRDSIQNFLREYNKAHHYAMIVSKAGDNILYADKNLNITSDVVKGLNKRYKPNESVLGKKK